MGARGDGGRPTRAGEGPPGEEIAPQSEARLTLNAPSARGVPPLLRFPQKAVLA